MTEYDSLDHLQHELDRRLREEDAASLRHFSTVLRGMVDTYTCLRFHPSLAQKAWRLSIKLRELSIDLDPPMWCEMDYDISG